MFWHPGTYCTGIFASVGSRKEKTWAWSRNYEYWIGQSTPRIWRTNWLHTSQASDRRNKELLISNEDNEFDLVHWQPGATEWEKCIYIEIEPTMRSNIIKLLLVKKVSGAPYLLDHCYIYNWIHFVHLAQSRTCLIHTLWNCNHFCMYKRWKTK